MAQKRNITTITEMCIENCHDHSVNEGLLFARRMFISEQKSVAFWNSTARDKARETIEGSPVSTADKSLN